MRGYWLALSTMVLTGAQQDTGCAESRGDRNQGSPCAGCVLDDGSCVEVGWTTVTCQPCTCEAPGVVTCAPAPLCGDCSTDDDCPAGSWCHLEWGGECLSLSECYGNDYCPDGFRCSFATAPTAGDLGVMPGECVPDIGCTWGDAHYQTGDYVNHVDGCNGCWCEGDGVMLCTEAVCGEPCYSDADCQDGQCEGARICEPAAPDCGNDIAGICRVNTAEGLCSETGGVWHSEPGNCGHYQCGAQWLDCAGVPGCDCGPTRNFSAGLGCVEDPACYGCNAATAACTPACSSQTDCPSDEICCFCLPAEPYPAACLVGCDWIGEPPIVGECRPAPAF